MALGRLTSLRMAATAALCLACGVRSVTVSVLAPALARDRSAPGATTFDGLPASETIVDRAFTVGPGAMQLEVDVVGPAPDVGYPRDFGVRGPAGIRGWTTARHGHVHIDAVSASYGYLPGPIEPGEWHVMFEPGAAVEALHVTVRVGDRLEGVRPTLRRGPGWFAGDLHVHSGHSDGYRVAMDSRDAPLSVHELAAAAASRGLDFVAITDHNTGSHWIDVDRTQTGSRNLLLLHGREITTAHGHFNAIGERRLVDFRIGPLRSMAQLLADVGHDPVFRSINHPWLASDVWCDACGWRDRDDTTLANADGVEVLNGGSQSDDAALPGWRLWADWLNRGHRLTAVGGSDVHELARGASIGTPSTVVWARDLSEAAIAEGLRSGRAFVRASPDSALFVELTTTGANITATMGEALPSGPVILSARLRGVAGMVCEWLRRGARLQTMPITGSDAAVTVAVDAVTGDWFSVVVRDRKTRQPVMISNPIYIGR